MTVTQERGALHADSGTVTTIVVMCVHKVWFKSGSHGVSEYWSHGSVLTGVHCVFGPLKGVAKMCCWVGVWAPGFAPHRLDLVLHCCDCVRNIKAPRDILVFRFQRGNGDDDATSDRQ